MVSELSKCVADAVGHTQEQASRTATEASQQLEQGLEVVAMSTTTTSERQTQRAVEEVRA